MSTDEISQRLDEYSRQAMERFPLKLVETTGDTALAKWQELKAAGHGTPVVLGGELGSILDPFSTDAPPLESVEGILRAAAGIRFPDDLAKLNRAEADASLKRLKDALAANPDMRLPTITNAESGIAGIYTREETIAAMLQEDEEPPLGEWPDTPSPNPGLTVAYDWRGGKAIQAVQIGIVPTDDWTTVPAYLRWGGWNACPAARFHVAAMRSWRDRYGAELVGINFDTINLRVANRPKTHEEALALAREQYIYCADIIDQGVGTYSALAADLMANDWWYFWWD